MVWCPKFKQNFTTCLYVSQIWKCTSKMWHLLSLQNLLPKNRQFSVAITTTSRLNHKYILNELCCIPTGKVFELHRLLFMYPKVLPTYVPQKAELLLIFTHPVQFSHGMQDGHHVVTAACCYISYVMYLFIKTVHSCMQVTEYSQLRSTLR